MAKKYTYSRTIETKQGQETFTAVECDSFDEAKNAVDRGINDRMIEFKSFESRYKEELAPKVELDAAASLKSAIGENVAEIITKE